MQYHLSFSARADKDLNALDRKVAKKIFEKLKYFLESGTPLKFAKPLSGALAGLYRFKIGDYRVVFDIQKKGIVSILLVLEVRHRRENFR